MKFQDKFVKDYEDCMLTVYEVYDNNYSKKYVYSKESEERIDIVATILVGPKLIVMYPESNKKYLYSANLLKDNKREALVDVEDPIYEDEPFDIINFFTNEDKQIHVKDIADYLMYYVDGLVDNYNNVPEDWLTTTKTGELVELLKSLPGCMKIKELEEALANFKVELHEECAFNDEPLTEAMDALYGLFSDGFPMFQDYGYLKGRLFIEKLYEDIKNKNM